MASNYESRIPEIIAKMETDVAAAVERAGYRFEAEAKSRARVDTGNMRREIRWSSTGQFTGQIEGGADYTVYNEYGTRYMTAQPMFGPAGEIVRPLFEQEIYNAVRTAVG